MVAIPHGPAAHPVCHWETSHRACRTRRSLRVQGLESAWHSTASTMGSGHKAVWEAGGGRWTGLDALRPSARGARRVLAEVRPHLRARPLPRLPLGLVLPRPAVSLALAPRRAGGGPGEGVAGVESAPPSARRLTARGGDRSTPPRSRTAHPCSRRSLHPRAACAVAGRLHSAARRRLLIFWSDQMKGIRRE